ncbi:MAG: diaminopimelate epimerase [Alphaproteobacteria bacterium]
MRFIKMHGLGNDFVILDLRDAAEAPARAKLAAMTDRKRGIGCDQLIILEPRKNPDSDLYMRILNAPDADEAEACGNATRCVAMLVMDEGGKDKVTIETVAGLLSCWRELDGRITVDMGVPKFGWRDIPLSEECDTLYLPSPLIPLPEGRGKDALRQGEGDKAVGVNVGNPHAVFFVEDVENFPVRELGPGVENNKLFPQKTNVEFVQVKSSKELRMRVWERNSGETEACGSGACAVLVAAVRRGLSERKADVVLDGGVLTIEWRESDDHILMTGAAAYVFEGNLNDEF